MSYIVKKQDNTKKLTKVNDTYLAGNIPKLWDQWNSDRQICLDLNNLVLQKLIPSKRTDGKIDQLPELYEMDQSMSASLKKEFFKTYEAMFNVKGQTYHDNEQANLQKDALINNFGRAKYVLTFLEICKQMIRTGEVNILVHWQEEHEQFIDNKTEEEIYQEKMELVRELVLTEQPVSEQILDLLIDKKKISMFTKFQGAAIKVIEAKNIVFDVNKTDDWEACPKIVRTYATYQQIVNDKTYAKLLTKQKIHELKELCRVKMDAVEMNETLDSDKDQARTHKGTLEVLDYWGDLVLSDGTILENHLCTVVAGKYVIRFEPNPYLECPIIHSRFLEHEEKKRGLSLLLIALTISQTCDTILQSQLEALKLIINKCYFGPDGAISGKTKVEPGGYIGYDAELMDKAPVALDFKDAMLGFDFISYFERKIESGTGIYKNMTGDPTGSNERTATEVLETTSGANTRLQELVDFMGYTIKIPIIEKSAFLLANFKFEEEEIRVDREGLTVFENIDEGVRRGRYDYIIEGSNEITLQRYIFQQTLPMIVEMMKDPVISTVIKKGEVIKWIFENTGVSDPGRFVDLNMLEFMNNQPQQQQLQQQQPKTPALPGPPSQTGVTPNVRPL